MTSLLVVAVNALLARLLSPEDFGRFLLVLSLATVLGTMVLAGLDQAVVRLLAQARGQDDAARARSILLWGVFLGLVFSAFGGACVVLFFRAGAGQFLFPETPLEDLAGVLGGLTAATGAQLILGECFRAKERYGAATMLGGQGLYGGAVSVSLTGAFLLTGAILAMELGSGEAALLTGIARALAAVAGGILIALALSAARPPAVMHGARLLTLGGTLWPTATTLLLLSHADLWVVGALLGGETLGLYGAASRLVLLMGVPIFVVNGVLPPLIARLYGAGEQKALERLMRGTATAMALPMLCVVAGLLLAPGPVLRTIFGPEYVAAAPLLQILALGWAVNVASGSPAKLLMMTRGERGLLVLTLSTGVLGCAAAVAGAFHGGAMGVAIAMAATLAVQNLLCMLLAKRRLGFWTVMYLSPWQMGAALAPIVRILRPTVEPVAAPSD